MSNLNDFKVEELEQRLEMKKWKAEASVAIGTDTNVNTGITTVSAGARLTF